MSAQIIGNDAEALIDQACRETSRTIEQVAQQLSITPQLLHKIRQAERDGTLSVGRLAEVAQQLGYELVCFFVPSEENGRELIRRVRLPLFDDNKDRKLRAAGRSLFKDEEAFHRSRASYKSNEFTLTPSSLNISDNHGRVCYLSLRSFLTLELLLRYHPSPVPVFSIQSILKSQPVSTLNSTQVFLSSLRKRISLSGIDLCIRMRDNGLYIVFPEPVDHSSRS